LLVLVLIGKVIQLFRNMHVSCAATLSPNHLGSIPFGLTPLALLPKTLSGTQAAFRCPPARMFGLEGPSSALRAPSPVPRGMGEGADRRM